MIIPDSGIWIDYLADPACEAGRTLQLHIAESEVGVLDLILCEVLQGIRHEDRFEEVRQLMTAFPIFSCVGAEMATLSATNYRLLRMQGITIRNTIDCLIATCCLRNGHALLHNDRDYDPFEKLLGLKVLRIPRNSPQS